MIYDVIIIGSGPAGLTAGLYSARGGLSTIVFEGDQPGGQLMTTTDVENWPGEASIKGPDLMIKMQDHARKCGAKLVQEKVSSVDFSGKIYKVETGKGKKTYEGKAVIIATGSSNKKLECPGEQEYWGKGVSTCATCDAPFYKDKEVVIVGGGNSAMTEAAHMLHFASKITIVHILDEVTANDPIRFKVLDHPKVEFIYNSTVAEIKGDGNHVTEAIVENQKDKSKKTIPTSAVFIAIGFYPNTSIFKDQLETNEYGYLKLKGHTKTSKPGVFAAGDVSDYLYRQAITSAGIGCMAALDAQMYLEKQDAE